MAGRRPIIAHMITWPDKLWMGITHSGMHTKGSLGSGWVRGRGRGVWVGGNSSQTHLAASSGGLLKSKRTQWVQETVLAVWLLFTLLRCCAHLFCSLTRHCWSSSCVDKWRSAERPDVLLFPYQCQRGHGDTLTWQQHSRCCYASFY